MFPIPNVPTDSIYKFIFITGVILVTFSLYLGNGEEKDFQRFQFSRDSISIATKHYLYLDSIEINTIKSDLEDLNSNISLYTDMQLDYIRTNDKNAARLEFIRERLKELKTEAKTLRDRLNASRDETSNYNRDREILLSSLDNRINKQEDNLSDINLYFWCGVFCFWLGIISWYFIVQVPQDKMNRIQLELATIQLAKEQDNTSSSPTPEPETQSNNNNPSPDLAT